MGLVSYFAPGKAKKAESKKGSKKPVEVISEKAPEAANSGVMSPMPRYPSAIGTPGNGSSPWASRPGSMFGNDNRMSQADELRDLKCDMMVNWLYQQQMELLWTAGGHDEGIVLKKSRGQYTCCPSDIDQEPAGFYKAIQTLNVRCAMTVNTRVIKLFLHGNDRPYVPLRDGLRLQVLPDISHLPRCQKHQFAAFIADRGILVVWDDEPRHLLKRSQDIQEALMAMIWPEEGEEELDEKDPKVHEVNVEEIGSDVDEMEAGIEKPRPIVLYQAIITAITLCLVTVAMGSGYAAIAKEVYLDGNYIRVAFVLALPAQVWLSLFFFQACTGNIAQIIGPIAQMNMNSKFYSGIAPKRLKVDDGPLPHLTIQCPVYKEGLTAVIEPTIRSIKAAISTYEMQGGTANIFVNDDGMQLISEEEARARQDFYDEHNIGWVARPRHDPKGEHGEPFTRRGKFKKASNMNYSLWASNRVEEKLSAIHRPMTWTQEDEAEAYRNALVEVVEEDQGRTWADGNIRIGDYILIIDSDTRVPTDCLLNAVSEMDASPQVGIIQFNSGVMNITDSFFEKGITFFTNLVYTQIKYAVANGDVAPFVGHNAVLRWAAVQSIGYEDEDNREKFWSESTVSEDFDMALRLQAEGFIVRYAAYFGDGFKEGVSLTVYDELARWEKYAFGCNELLFHPVAQWFKKGPFTPLFRRFIFSSMPLPSKLTIMAYIGTYYALGSSWILTVMNYFIIGWFNGWLDHFYLNSFSVYLAIVVVFSGLGNIALAVLRYRIEEMALLRGLWTNFKYVPLMTIFLGGVSMHVSQALLSHMFGIDMNWGATSKEAENTTFFEEVPKVIKSFKFTFAICITLAAIMVVCAYAIPELWRIDLFIAIWPLSTVIFCHFMLPIALNPNLMLFTW